MKIGIFGGTFNPIHDGHLNIVKDAKEELGLDAVYFVPSYKTPDKQFSIEKIDPKKRFNMVKKTIKSENLPWLKISNFEMKQKTVSYTYKTIRHFKDKFPKDDLYWIMGEDRYRGFSKWEKSNEIKENAKIIIYRRNETASELISKDKEVIYLKDKFYDISSTLILNELKWKLIPEVARKYISKNKLYLKTIVFNVLRDKRYQHSVAVASHSKRLAKQHGYKKAEKAWTTGLLHDLFKLFDDDYLKDYYDKNATQEEKIEFGFVPPKVLHGIVVALWLREEYLWDDKEVFNALARHTLSHQDASKLDKIIYVADKVSTDRKGDKVGKMRLLAYNNLDLTYTKLIKEHIKYLNKINKQPHEQTMAAYRKFVGKIKGDIKYEFNIKKNRRKDK